MCNQSNRNVVKGPPKPQSSPVRAHMGFYTRQKPLDGSQHDGEARDGWVDILCVELNCNNIRFCISIFWLSEFLILLSCSVCSFASSILSFTIILVQ